MKPDFSGEQRTISSSALPRGVFWWRFKLTPKLQSRYRIKIAVRRCRRL